MAFRKYWWQWETQAPTHLQGTPGKRAGKSQGSPALVPGPSTLLRARAGRSLSSRCSEPLGSKGWRERPPGNRFPHCNKAESSPTQAEADRMTQDPMPRALTSCSYRPAHASFLPAQEPAVATGQPEPPSHPPQALLC